MASSHFPVAIIGMATRLPGARTCDEFWELLKDGGDTVDKFPQQRIPDVEHVLDSFRGQLVNEKQPFFTGSFFHSVDTFDANLFQINPKEALFLEPEQRFFLETTWEALEDAGYAATVRGSKTGVYVGNTVNKYKYILTENHPSISHGNHSPFISSRVSYTHDLQGPAMMVATGCSSSLLAVHIACQGLLSGDCDMAIAGGITLDLLPISAKTDIWNQLGITGPNVRCRPFDASAKGIAKGEGCGVVVLKPLAKAVVDGDHIYGILEATTANQDGHSNGITAPHPGAQASMLCKAWELANITPDILGYFETHGTGTELGDPIEISGITNAFKTSGFTFGEKRSTLNKIPIGSVKGNIGHLADGAAGVVSLIKVLLCLHKESIPPAINFTTPNPHINWVTAPVYVNTSLKEWKSSEDIPTRYACVSAFGLLGTNVHAVVREYKTTNSSSSPLLMRSHKPNESQLLTIAANTKLSLVTFVGKITKFFQDYEEKSYEMLRNICYTLNTSREQRRFQYRAIAFGTSWNLMTRSLENLHRKLSLAVSPGSSLPESTSADNGYFINFDISSERTPSILECPSHFYIYAKRFLDGIDISWEVFHAGTDGLKRVPLIPTYAFDCTRFWPKKGKAINMELLRLEHCLAPRVHPICNSRMDFSIEPNRAGKSTHNIDEGKQASAARSDETIRAVVHSTLNDVLNTNYDWQEMATENLFALGMDSLICTQLSMKLHESVKCSIPLAAFHKNPTCAGLIRIVEEATHPEEELKRTTDDPHDGRRIPTKDKVGLLLGSVLNDSLGTSYDWQEMESENLFALGFDSLTLTEVNMKLSDELSLEEPFTMAELRNFSTYGLLRQIICEKRGTLESASGIVKQGTGRLEEENQFDEQTMFPLSYSQKRLWVMEEMCVSTCTYNATNCLRISGKFHPEAFTAATNTVLSRHAAFFTVFNDTNDGPRQNHNWQLDVKVEVVDIQQDEPEQTAMKLYSDDYKTPFDLRVGPLVRCRLYRLPNDVFYYTMVVHHIVFDGWSHFVFYNEIWDAYQKLCAGKEVAKDLHYPLYTEFAMEEQDESSLTKFEAHVTYWKEKLASPLPSTTFPGDKRRPAVFTHRGERITRFLDNASTEALREFCSEKYTVFIKLLSMVFALLHQYTGDRDLIIGTPVAGRNDLRVKHVIGCFVNTLAIRVHLPENCSFANILDEVSAVFLEAFCHQQVPFDHIVSQLNLPRDTGVTPVFSVNVCYHNTEIKADHTSPPNELNVERKLLHNGTTKWDMQFDFLQEPEGMRFTLEYYNDLFSDKYAEGIVDAFLWLMKSFFQNNNVPLTQFLLQRDTGTEEQQLAGEVSILRGPVRVCEKSLPELLMDSFRAHADNTAIIETTGSQTTYKQLIKHSNEFSFFLREVCQLSRQSRIGLLLDNSVQTVEFILASVFSGLVYVPMDPGNPQARLEHVCNEAEIKAIIFSRSHIAMSNRLHWACPSVQFIICADSQEFLTNVEIMENSPLMDVELWNCVANNAKDDIEGGGWKSSYTGEHMTAEEMDEYGMNVLTKLKEHIKPNSKVLEIGCASGLTVQKLCPLVGHYVATDRSQTMITRLEEKLGEKGITNVEVLCVSAEQLEHAVRGKTFDLIIMNSVLHCFPGHNYLRHVFRTCERLLNRDGIIFLGDIMDLELKEKMIMSLKNFKKANPKCRVKTHWQNELFLSRDFMQHLCDSSSILKSVTTSRKHYTVANELTEFRFDALFRTSEEYYRVPMKEVRKQAFALQDIAKAVETQDKGTVLQAVLEWSRFNEQNDEAYVLYTSGTTGTPKGVIIGHEALLNYATWAAKAYQFDPNTLTPFFAPLTFDFTITSIFPPLLSGSIIQVFEPFQDSYQAMADSSIITTAKFSPLQLDTILSTCKQALNASTFIVGGEELMASLLQKLKKNKGDNPFVVWNEYGPTEATVGCVVRCFTSDELPNKESGLVPIGKPIDNVTVAVVRNESLPVPRGAKGHLAIGGKCLCLDFAGTGQARDAKREKSLKASSWGRPGEQMLLTEDIVELMPSSGDLIYFGRESNSETTKVNGVRVDMLEVQQMIESDPTVASAWVCSFIHENNTFLGAAVKCESDEMVMCGDATWKRHLVSSLAQVLPLRSIPKVFVRLSVPPTNKNGKKDVRNLQKIFQAEMIAEKESICHSVNSSISSPPSGLDSKLTEKLQGIWHSILPISHIPNPKEDFFFDLSGDSLQAIHLVRKMRDEGFAVSVTDIFQYSSIEKIAPVLAKREKNESTQVLADDKTTPFHPTPIVQDFFGRKPPLKQPDRFPLSALLNFHGEISPQILQKALRSVMMKHGSLHSRFEVSHGKVFQQVIPIEPDQPTVDSVIIERTEDHLVNEQKFTELCEKLEGRHSLEHGQLVNAAIVNVRHSSSPMMQHFALLVVHHVALDIVSWQQVLEDLASALRRLSEDDRKEPVLPKCQVTFQTYCEALHAEINKLEVEEVEYWRGIEEESSQSGRLVEADQQSSFQSARWLSRSIDAASMRTTSSRLGCSEESILLTAFGRAIASIHGQNKTSICLESHGRQLATIDSTDTVGWCTSKFPVVVDTSTSSNLVKQVKDLELKLKEIPNRGLAYGLLKSRKLLTMPLPKIMFVYQGSLDASSKETFDGGQFSFDHIPWIETMLNELKKGRFHRHPEEYLEFDLEIIGWIYGGELKLGCLFDENVITKELADEIMEQAQFNIMAMIEKAKTEPKEVTLEIIPAFNITPDCVKSMTNALSHHATILTEIRIQPPEQMLQVLCKHDSAKPQLTADVTVLIPRPMNAEQAEEFVKASNQFKARINNGKFILVVNTENLSNTFKFPIPSSTEEQFTLTVDLPNTSCFYDNQSDLEYNMPFTQPGYSLLGETVARGIRACVWDSKYKVIAVDADYTLWDGECAQESVQFNQGNYALHEFLLKKKAEGMLLVILSKNHHRDLERVFDTHANEMKLKKNDFALIIANWDPKSKNLKSASNLLNLATDSFVFIDDNPLECEEMIKCSPEVLTLQLPSSVELVASLLDNLWALDRIRMTAEASTRTEMYQNELARKMDLKSVKKNIEEEMTDLNKLLLGWEMELEICKTTVGVLSDTEKLHRRAKELLRRTNQFKMNSLNVSIDEKSDKDVIWLASLKDKYGMYGVVSIVLLEKTMNDILVSQWILSCRALGRGVEASIFKEIHDEALKLGKGVKFAINKTERNTPAVRFLESAGVETSTISPTKLTVICSERSTQVSEPLMSVKVVTDLRTFSPSTHGAPDGSQTKLNNDAGNSTTFKDSYPIPTASLETSCQSSPDETLMKLNQWIEDNWTKSQKHQAVFHDTYPLFRLPGTTKPSHTSGNDESGSDREVALRSSWMKVLHTTDEPKDSDSFIQSGGNSFSAVYLVSMLRRVCAIEISIADVLQNRTYADLKKVVQEAYPLNEEIPSRPGLDRIHQFCLSTAQQRMLLMQQTAPGSTAYVETIAYRTKKVINPDKIISTLIKRHPILKSKVTINSDDSEYLISIDEEMQIHVETEWVNSDDVSEDHLKETTPVISIIDSSLVSIRHILAKQHKVLVLHIHHIIADDITLSNIACDLEQLMQDDTLIETNTSPSQSYAKYVEEEIAYLRSIRCKRDREFWEKNFENAPAESNMAIRSNAELRNFDTRVYHAKHFIQDLSTEAARGIVAYCQTNGLTEFQYFLSCAALVLQRYLGNREVTIAIPVTTRTEDHANTDGPFLNTILCRLSTDCALTIKEYIKAVATQWLETLDHSKYPLDHVTKALWEMHGKNSSSFCSVMFNFVARHQNENEVHVYAKHAKMPFSLDVVSEPQSQQIKIIAEWANELIDEGIAERLTDSVFQLCSTAYVEDHKSLQEVDVLSLQEQKLLQSFSTTSAHSSADEYLPIHSSFESYVETSEKSIAVAIEDRCLSYCQLDEISSKVASALCDRVTEDALKNRPVVIVGKKDEFVIAAIFGVWKAGGHFLPVAATNQSSLKSILSQNMPAAILTNLPTDTLGIAESCSQGCPLFPIEHLVRYAPKNCKENRPSTSAKDLAYIIQTSGSTGTPKQCKITHKSLRIIANAWRDRYAMREIDVNVLQWAPLSFDVFIGDVVRALVCSPGRLTICPDDRRLDIPYILQLVEKQQITMAEVTPLFGQQLIDNANQNQFSSVKVFILGSDSLQRHVYCTIKEKLNNDQRVLNSYGMTEATIDSSFFEGDTLPLTRSDTVPIGTPLPGVEFHILDSETLLPCPVGTVGELHIAGDVLASGDVDLVDVPCLDRLALKTGDSACWLPSGDVELMGRLDNVKKLRGFRISTTEIENKIVATIDAVKQVCVVSMSGQQDTETKNEFLCAFLVIDQTVTGSTKIDSNYVRSKLSGDLPFYMLPDIVQIVQNIPISTNGKVDYKALPNLSDLLKSESRPTERKNDEESPTARTLIELFAEALGFKDVSQVDQELTFMEQGAHSLILVKFSTLIAQRTTFGVTIADIFSYPTISALEHYITQNEPRCEEAYQLDSNARTVSNYENDNEGIAITGIGLRLPGNIMTLPQLWEVLESGNDAIGDFPERRCQDVLDCLLPERVESLSETETFQGAFFDRIDEFDSKFFKIPAGEAKFMSPEQRLFLQVATEALAESMPLSEVYGSKIGVFVGASEIGYSQLHHPDDATCVSGLLPGMIATRVAYQWNLRGPTMLLDTACSSSLIALKEACHSIKRGECEGALVGGVSLVLYPSRTGVFGKTSILSDDFKCRPFDKDATGTAVGEGVLCLFVEPTEKALLAKKPIYGIVKSVASNSVGRGNGITAPSANSQYNVIQDALTRAGVQPSEVTYIEAHGTGTKLGDRMELSALRSLFKDTRASGNNLIIGSVKSVFGHLDASAGILGVFKTLASLCSKKIPPTVHFKTPHAELVNSGLSVSDQTVHWQPSPTACSRIAGVSSFGLTGTNCHAIIAERPMDEGNRVQEAAGQRNYHLLVAGSDLSKIKRQLHLHKIHIQQSILKSGYSTIAGMCLTVANRLKEFSKLKANMEWRLIVTANDPTQMHEVVEIAEAVPDVRALIQLAKLRKDIHLFCPQYHELKSAFSDVDSFLQHGTINIDGLFYGESGSIRPSPGVTVVVYNERRYWLDPCEKTLASTRPLHIGELLGIKLNETRELVRSLPTAPPVDLEQTLGTFCSAIIIKLFMSTALADHLISDRNITFEEAFAVSEMLPKYQKLFFVMVRELWRNKLLKATGTNETVHFLDSFVFKCKQHLQMDPDVIAQEAVQKYPAWADCFRFPLYCSKQLLNVVKGKVSPLSVIYPHGDLNFMFQFDKLGDLLGDVYYNMYMQLIASYAVQLSGQGKHVRILEVGAGVGHVTRQILPKLKNTPNVEYWFTDLGKAFVEHAKTVFAEYAEMMKFATFDITKNAPKQGLLGSFDIIVSYNVIHTTQSIMDSVVNLKSCLGGDGTLFIIESAKNETWATLAWGILDGWWYFKDYDLRPAEPMMEAEKWERVLHAVGFQSMFTCPIQDDERCHVEKFMFVCSEQPVTSFGRRFQVCENPGWWETDTQRFDPTKNLEELQKEAQMDDQCTGQNEIREGKHTVYEALKKIWAELLGEEEIHSEDDFNSLGGESLLAIQMMNLVKKRIGFQLEIADTFGYPTLGSLANFIITEMSKDIKMNVTMCNISDPKCHSTNSSQKDGRPESIIHSLNLPASIPSAKPERFLLMFPGQGSQKVGMCVSMKESIHAQKVFSLAEEVLGYNVLDICLGDENVLQQKLKSTEFVQVSLFVGCLAKIEQLRVERPEILSKVTHVAGLSVGEFAALVYAGVISFQDGLKLVSERGRAMESLIKETPTGMVSVLGPECKQLEVYLEKTHPSMTISTYLADNQHTVAGIEEECNSLVECLSKQHENLEVVDVRKLRVAGAFHSPYMAEASAVINDLILGTHFSIPSLAVIMNVNGDVVTNPVEIKRFLGQQLTAGVRWRQSVVTAYKLGVRSFIEVAPGRVLSSIVKNRIKECQGCDVEYIQV